MDLALGGDLDGLQKELFGLDELRKRQDKHIASSVVLAEELRAMNLAQAELLEEQRLTMRKLEAQHADVVAKLNTQVIRAQAAHQAQLQELVNENLRLRRKLRGKG
jgi:hypothetical protein